jgi:hypothetical protein
MASTYYYSNCSGSLSVGCYLYTDSSSLIPVSGGYYSNGSLCFTVSSSGMITSTGSCPYLVNWYVSGSSGGTGILEIRDASGSQVLLVSSSLDASSNGTVCISTPSYSVTGSWGSGMSNIVRYRVCYPTTNTELFYSYDINSVTSSVVTDIFPAGTTTVFLTSGTGLTPPAC